MIKRGLLAAVLFLLMSVVPVLGAGPVDLTGVWGAAPGATFYVRQTGHEIWWFGEQPNAKPAWSHVAQGTVDGNTVHVRWVDVPKGDTQHQGTVTLQVVDPNHLKVTQNPGGFLKADWFRKSAQHK